MMIKQKQLTFLEQEDLEELWERFPKQAKEEMTRQYARLMARVTVQQIRALRKTEANREVSDESHDG